MRSATPATRYRLRPAIALACAALVAGCASAVPAGSDEAAFIASGARRIAPEERAQLLVGNTVVGNGFRVYYAPDGRKRVRAGGLTLERRWRIAEDGTFCEELTRSRVEVCVDSGRLYEKDGLFRAFRPDGSAVRESFRLVEGDAG